MPKHFKSAPASHAEPALDATAVSAPVPEAPLAPTPAPRARGGMSVGKVVGIIAGVLLLCLLVLGGTLWFSVQRIQGHVDTASNAANELTAALDKLDSAAILASSQTISQEVNAVQQELDGVPWRIAGVLPIVNEDVGIARQALTITHALSDDALVPLAQSYDQLTQTFASSSFSLESLGSNVGALQDLSNKLVAAGDVIVTARRDAAGVGTSHFDAINKAVDQMRELLDKASDLYESNEEAIKGVQAILGAGSDFLSTLLGGSDAAAGADAGAAATSQDAASLPAAA